MQAHDGGYGDTGPASRFFFTTDWLLDAAENAGTAQAYACADGCPVAALDGQAGERSSGKQSENHMRNRNNSWFGNYALHETYGDTGPASRFFQTADWSLDVAEQLDKANPVFYCGKASASERHAGLHGRNDHPTVKPLALLKWLATLLLPPAAYAPRRLLVPFCGTGSEMIAATMAGWEDVVGIEREARYVALAKQRLSWWTGWTPQAVVPSQEKPPTPPAGSPGQLSLF
jgi:DNA modification methylase